MATTVALTASWSIDAMSSDDDGLWPIGAALVCIGTMAVSGTLAFIARRTMR
ncbi:hypothetical protein [Actinomadura rubrisoli]|uniref:hypothetical protein n=1 Tax=Actinomadura rubrisoli TaxID=2530368 RepID=UPI00140534E1|nr:hypothetical protein [Actinomadura rubrisoli]